MNPQYHKTSVNPFQYNSHIKRHSLNRVLVEQDGTSSIDQFIDQNNNNGSQALDYETAGVTPFDDQLLLKSMNHS